LDLLQYQVSDGLRYHYLLNKPIPKAVFDGLQSGGTFLVVERPAIEVDTQAILGERN
jgi:hypothetical protein